MLKYHEIYPLENAAEKISSELDYQKDIKPRLYKSSVERYKKLQAKLIEAAKSISVLLDEDPLIVATASEDELPELSNYFDEDGNVNSEEVEAAATITSVHNAVTAETTSSNQNSNSQSHDNLPSYEDKSSLNKKILSTYAHTIIHAEPTKSLQINETLGCLDIIKRWFSTRFIYHCKDFKYNIDQFPTWITNIAFAYGYNYEQGTLREHLDMWNKWFKSVEDNSNTKWALPYDVLQYSKNSEYTNRYTASGYLIALDISESYFKALSDLEDIGYYSDIVMKAYHMYQELAHHDAFSITNLYLDYDADDDDAISYSALSFLDKLSA